MREWTHRDRQGQAGTAALRPHRPMMRYHGGKWRIAPWIISHFPAHRIYTEVFGGGAAVLLQKPRVPAEVYNDLDREIVNLFAVVRDSGDALRELIRLTPFARSEFDLSYEPSTDPVEQARRTLIRSFMGYGTTMTRTNVTDGRIQRSGFRGVRRDSSATASDWTGLPDGIERIIHRLCGVVIENADAVSVLQRYDAPDALHYIDPPYVHAVRQTSEGGHQMGYRHECSDADHERLAECLHGLSGMIVLSGYPSDLYRRLYGGWEMVQKRTFTINAQPRTEVLWLRNISISQLSLGIES